MTWSQNGQWPDDLGPKMRMGLTQAGQMVAVVGPSGAGKSTLSSLVTRLFDPTSGAVLVGGLLASEASRYAAISVVLVLAIVIFGGFTAASLPLTVGLVAIPGALLVLRVLSAEKSGKQSLDVAGLLKIRGSEIQQRYTELMMLAAGPYSLPFIKEAMEAGWQGDQWLGGAWIAGADHAIPLTSNYLNVRKTTIYGGSNEVQRNILARTVLGLPS